MSTLTIKERSCLEKLFKMESGYVLDYSDSTFNMAIYDCMNIDANDQKYLKYGTSKAKRLRAIWDIESDGNVGMQIKYFIEHIYENRSKSYFWKENPKEDELIKSGEMIVQRLLSLRPDVIISDTFNESNDESIVELVDAIKREIGSHKPHGALDRTHTLFIKYLRLRLKDFEVLTDKNTPLHGLYGTLVKCLRERKLIETEMSEKILRSLNPILEKYSDIRNNRSMAHDNEILGVSESLFILNSIANAISYINSIVK